MSIAMNSICLECHFQRNLKMARTLGTEEQTLAFAKELMKLYISAPENVSSPWFTPHTEDIFDRIYDHPDLYGEAKRFSNAFVLERLDQIREKVRSAPDPVYAGLQFAILGNYIDFAALQGKVSFEKLEEMLNSALEMELDRECYARFCRELSEGRNLLYLTDNAGEIGFDRVFAEELIKQYPHLNITFCVRGSKVLNDATREDAAVVGIPFPVIDNGNRVSGTQIDMLGDEAREALENAHVIIAKGMANTETMLGCGYNVYYAFLVKCPRIGDHFGAELFTPLLVRERA